MAIAAMSEKAADPAPLAPSSADAKAQAIQATREEDQPDGTLTPAQIAARLHSLPSNVVKEMFAFVQKLSDVEAGRQQRLDAKATALLTAVGLSLTVAFTFGAFLLKDGGSFWKTTRIHGLVVFVFVVALVSAALAALMAILALFVTTYSAVGENTVFNEAILNRVREDAVPETEPGTERDPKAVERAEALALAQYHQSMIMALWAPMVTQRKNHGEKACRVLWGQRAFAGFLGAVLVLFGFLGYAAYTGPSANAPGSASPADRPPGPTADQRGVDPRTAPARRGESHSEAGAAHAADTASGTASPAP